MKEDEIYRMLTGPEPAEAPGKREEEPSPSPAVLQRASNPSRLGEIPSAQGHAVEQGECGDIMAVYLSVSSRVIREARFDTLGCGYTVACGDVAMEMAENRPLADALGIRPEDVARALGGLPASHEHCARLAVRTLRSAVCNAMDGEREPWKKLYG